MREVYWNPEGRILTMMYCLCSSFDIKLKNARKPTVRLRFWRIQDLWIFPRHSLPTFPCVTGKQSTKLKGWLAKRHANIIISLPITLSPRYDAYNFPNKMNLIKEKLKKIIYRWVCECSNEIPNEDLPTVRVQKINATQWGVLILFYFTSRL